MILKNLINFIKNNKLLFALLITTQIAAVVIILFSFGVYRNNQYMLAEGENENQSLRFLFNYDRNENIFVEVSRIQNDLIEIAKKYDNLVEDVVIYSYGNISKEDVASFENGENSPNDVNKIKIRSEFSLRDNKKVSYSSIHNAFVIETIGRNFTEDELINGAKVCFASSEMYTLHSDYWSINDILYEVIAYEEPKEGLYAYGWSEAFIIPFSSLAGNMELDWIAFTLKRPLLRSEYESIKAEFTSRFSEAEMEVSDFYSIEIDEKTTMKTMMLAAVFMSFISTFSVCLIYRYMLTKRIKMTAIYRLCGCTTVRSSFIYIGEMMVALIASCAIGSVIFELLVEPVLEKNYTWFAVIYGNYNCYLLVLMYFIIVSFIASLMITISNKSTPKELLNGVMK